MAFDGDPRKRPATKSPEGGPSMAQKRAPVAPMAPFKKTGDITSALSDFMNASIALAKLDLKLDAAKEVCATKTREYNNLLPQFAAFPAIKEEKSRAKAIAEKDVTNLEMRMQQERTGSQHVIAVIADMISPKAMATPTLSRDESLLGQIKSVEQAASICKNRLDALESAAGTSSATTSSRADLSDLTARVDAIEKDIEATQNETFETIEETLKEKDQEITTKMNDLRTQLKNLEAKDKVNATDLATLRTHITESDKVQYQNAEAINDCLKRLGLVEAASDKASTAEGLATVEANVTLLEERVKKVEARRKAGSANNGEVPGMLQFQPVVYSESEDSWDSDAEQQPGREKNGTKSSNPKGMQLVKGEIERLRFMTRQHETRLNNLTTEEVVKQMGDVYSNLYPQARNFEATSNNLNGQLIHIGTKLATLSSQIDALSLRVDAHDKAVSDGQNGITKLSGDIQQVADTIKQLISRINKMDK
ncbi:uncharacterized protein MYCFIDRAFT_82097 [Pseudocercospora fijiensis CIRAD86]|uniref:Uncharacterized protein n=1 Tax=Pseudocercospora fijiensis (strain CIRAD86) TaxID=383855 RepID=M3BA78_PSEFD|nr:uncharacterized protein MYCFIDRAFT_82097 [Pseudocercospora fijiensis CIRAD86]EME86163.1 hypothetical protein MYCFIDRAFT_82097 [Pseudocercospora fijiensis CIRAD86]